MTPTLLSAIITAFAEALRAAPQLVADIQAIFAKGEPTEADWEALKARVSAKSYFDYVPDSSLPKPEPPAYPLNA